MFWLAMVRHTDIQMTVIKEEVCSEFSRNRKHYTPHMATWGGTGVSQEAEGKGENVGRALYCVFHGKEF